MNTKAALATLCTVGSLLSGTGMATAQAAPLPTAAVQTQTPDVQRYINQFKALPEGGSFQIPGTDGQPLTVTKTNGKPVLGADIPQGRGGFCHAAALAAVTTVGAGGLAFLASIGGGVIFGVFISQQAAAAGAAIFGIGAGIDAWVANYLC